MSLYLSYLSQYLLSELCITFYFYVLKQHETVFSSSLMIWKSAIFFSFISFNLESCHLSSRLWVSVIGMGHASKKLPFAIWLEKPLTLNLWYFDISMHFRYNYKANRLKYILIFYQKYKLLSFLVLFYTKIYKIVAGFLKARFRRVIFLLEGGAIRFKGDSNRVFQGKYFLDLVTKIYSISFWLTRTFFIPFLLNFSYWSEASSRYLVTYRFSIFESNWNRVL